MTPSRNSGGGHYATVVAAYLAQLLGTDRAADATRRALTELDLGARGSNGATPDIAAVRKVVQSVGLDVLDREARGLGRRIAQVAHGRTGCSAVARRLRDRAEGRISPGELSAFYHHLAECRVCASVVAQFETAQWHLQGELASVNPRTAVPASPPPVVPPPPVRVEPPPAPVEPPVPVAAAAAPMPPTPVEPPPAAPPPVDPSAADRGPMTHAVAQPPRTQRRRGPAPRWVRGLLLAVVVAGVGVAVFLQTEKTGKKPAKSRPPTQTTLTPSPATPTPPATTTAGSHGPGTPFVIAGARFAVFVNPRQTWTAFTKTVPPAPGSKWLLVTVRVRDLTRDNLDPRVLHYRLVSTGGQNYFPKLAYGTGPDVGRAPHPLARGALVQAELAFQVPVAAPPLQLAFDPFGKKGSVSVALGT